MSKSFVFLFIATTSYSALAQADELEPPATTGASRCGAGTLVLRAESIYDSDSAVYYNWYDADKTLIETIESGVFVTPPIIASKDYYVSITIGDNESEASVVTASIENTASVLEKPIVSLCDSVILESQSTFTSSELVGATYQWQKYVVLESGEGVYQDLEGSDSQAGPDFTLYNEGFFRVVITLSDGCKAISESVEVTFDNIIHAEIVYESTLCFEEGIAMYTTLESDEGREITSYLWEESLDSISFYDVGTDEDLIRFNPTPVGEDSAVRYYRLTLFEENCEKTSPIVKQVWYKKPEGELQRKGSTDDFFYCPTDPEEDRILKVSSANTDLAYIWRRLQRADGYSLDDIKNIVASAVEFEFADGGSALLGEFDVVGSGGDSLILGEDDWGLYVVVMLDMKTGCEQLTNFIFVDSAIPLFDFSKEAVCVNLDTVTISAYDDTADSYSWSFSNTETGPFSEIGTSDFFEVYPEETIGEGWYSLHVSKNGCEAEEDPRFLLESEIPFPTASPGASVICPGDSVLLLSSDAGDGSYGFLWEAIGSTDTLAETTTYWADTVGTYSMTIYNTYCAFTTNQLVVSMSDVAADSLKGLSNDSLFCQPTVLELAEVSDGDSYQWFYTDEGTSELIVSDTSAIRADSVGGFYVEITNPGGCTSQSDTFFISSVLDPTLLIGDSILLCGAEPTYELETAPSPGDWFVWLYRADGGSGFDTLEEGENIYKKILEDQGLYRVLIQDGVCSAYSEAYVKVNTDVAEPFEAEIEGDSVFCFREEVLLTSSYISEEAHYIWEYSLDSLTFTSFGEDSSVVSLDSSLLAGILNGQDSVRFFVRLDITDGVCSDLSEVHSIVLNNEIELEIYNVFDGSKEEAWYCGGMDVGVTLNAGHNYTPSNLGFQWQMLGSDSVFADVPGASLGSFDPEYEGVYRCVASSISGESCTDTSNLIWVHPRLIAQLTSTDSISLCGNSSTTVISANFVKDASYMWLHGVPGEVRYDTVFTELERNTLSVSDSGYYWVQISVDSCSLQSDSVYVDVNVGAEAPEVIINGPLSVCAGVNTVLSSSYISATADYEWLFSDGGAYSPILGTDSLKLDTDFINAQMDGDEVSLLFQLNVSDQECNVASDVFEVVFYKAIDIQITGPGNSTDDVYYCSDGELGFKLYAHAGVSSDALGYQWQRKNSTGDFVNIALGVQDDFQPTGPGTYRLIARLTGSGCEDISNEINVVSLPNTIFSPKQNLCADEPIEMLAGGSDSEFSLQWFHSTDGASFDSLEGQTSDMLIINSDAPIYGSGHYYYTATNAYCSVASDTLEFYVEPRPDFEVDVSNAACLGVNNGEISVTVEDSSTTYSYSLNDSLINDSGTFSALAPGLYKVLIQTPLGCRDSVNVSVGADMDLSLTVSEVTSQRPGIPFKVKAEGAAHYQWEPAEYFTDPTASNPTVLVPEELVMDTLLLYVTGTSEEGCTTSRLISVPLMVEEDLVFSKFISPNGDGINDYFEVVGIDESQGSQLVVFDNWGREIFKSANYRNGSPEAVKLNSLLTEGTFFYIYKVESEIFKGNFYFKP